MSAICRRNHLAPAIRKSNGFTLVEMLVVIAIIAMLISILLPTLTKAIRATRNIACQSNLRQIGAWALMYAQDNQGYLPVDGDTPPYPMPGNAGSSYTPTGWWQFTTLNWPGLTAPYGGFWKARPGLSASTVPGSAINGVSSGTILQCPEALAEINVRQYCNGYTYGLNQYLGGRENFTAGKPPTPKLNLLTNDVYWFGDGRCSFNGTAGNAGWDFTALLQLNAPSDTPTTAWPWTWPTPGVSGGWSFQGHANYSANFVFGDGHVEGISLAQFEAMSPAPTTAFTPSATMIRFVGYPF